MAVVQFGPQLQHCRREGCFTFAQACSWEVGVKGMRVPGF